MMAQMISMNQCNHAWLSAIFVTAGCRLSWLTAGPPGRSCNACAKPDDKVSSTPPRNDAFVPFASLCILVMTTNSNPKFWTR